MKKFLIVTDRIGGPQPIQGDGKVIWGKGVKLYYCGNEAVLDYAIGGAVEFETPEAAELRIMILCLLDSDLVGHIHVIEKDEAWKQWHEDLKDFESRAGLDKSSEARGSCY